MARILVLHGPNLNTLGIREPDHYGSETLADVNQRLVEKGQKWGCQVDTFQSNIEGELINQIHSSMDKYDAIIMNPGAYTHYSYAIFDAIQAITVPVIEVHISNIHTRETFRHSSVIAPACKGQIVGFGTKSYDLALMAVREWIEGA
ncbi:type II 3-dehydroquinate dehydratase [Shimazuella alba]|uniref:3-dehydroquinate dehydratase n=1 Tax=Shimazuella alba TaxID=2690964 RepID=A0A6I4VTL9_9BACL|nr:type II 3-dehydroquinate dehydratase [Shimazuella alba]MXQ55109.1 type II 3-dehydroquinate dehydratase [Shimazuella alba]